MEAVCYELETYAGREGRRRVSRHVPQPPASVISDVSFWTITIFTPSTLSLKSYILLEVYGQDYFVNFLQEAQLVVINNSYKLCFLTGQLYPQV